MLGILVIRHGQSIADIEGRADYPLTELGIKQAQLMSEWISKNYPPEIIISSTLKRTSMTADILAKKLNLNVIYDEELMEWNNGVLVGLKFDEVKIMYPKPDGGRKPHERIKDGESLIEFRARAKSFWSKFYFEYINSNFKKVAMITHGKMISMLFRSFLN